MSKMYTCSECGNQFSKSKIDWEASDEEMGQFYCESCTDALAQAGINAMDPDGNGYDEDGYWDGERLGF